MLVRPAFVVGLLLAVLSTGCTKREAPNVEHSENEAASASSPPVDARPEPTLQREPLAMPPGDDTTRLQIVEFEDGIGNCGFDVLGRGLPAVELRKDGTAAAVYDLFRRDIDASAEEWPTWHPLELQRLDLDGEVASRDALHGEVTEVLGEAACAQLRSTLKNRVEAANAMLAAMRSSKRLRPMKELGVAFADTSMADAEVWLPERDGVLQMRYAAGHFVLRVRDAKVLAKQAKPQWRREVDLGPTQPDPDPVSLWADPQTGVAVVYVTHGSPVNDHGDDAIHPRVTTLPPEALAEIEARPYPYRHPLFHWDRLIRRSR